jgi:hypothetical protein
MINSLEYLDVRRGRDIFVLVAALMSAMALELLLRRNWQASLPVVIALAFRRSCTGSPNEVLNLSGAWAHRRSCPVVPSSN